jgi:hypothetical protein
MMSPASLLTFTGTLALNGLFSCVTKVCRAVRRRPAAVLAVLGLLGCCATSMPLAAQDSQQRPVKDPERETWRKAMVRTPLPKRGCFQVSYPNKEWREVACSKAPARPVHPQRGGGNPPVVGGGGATDWSAESAGTITTAEGSFLSTNGVTSETDSLDGLANSFSLQLNTRPITNSTTVALCKGAAVPSSCQGWAQFVYSNNAPSPYCTCGYIQYWLVPYGGATCPSGWSPDVGDCYLNGNPVPISGVTIANLGLMTVTGEASGGTDTAIVDNGSGTLTATNSDSAVDLEQSWNVAEFNVFGNGGGSQAVFNGGSTGSTIDVETSIIDGTTNPPACLDQSFTGESNNLNLANVTGSTTQLVCCSYGGSPRIEFMETNATPPHTATCGPTRIEGDPHITTADGTHYDFQGAGEFISLRDSDGAEIQTRQTPIATTGLGTDAHDGLSTCVSLNSAVAARVGEHRVTYEPNVNGRPDPTGLQLRIDGVLAVPGPNGINLGDGGRVAQSSSGGNLEIDFPDGKTLFVTPQFWTTYGTWYLNADVTNAGLVSTDGGGAALRGIAGPILSGSWLPALPSGASMGPMPAGLAQRYSDLYHKFADAWRVTKKDSLFDYAPGTSTDTFTDKSWPLEKAPCVVPETKPVEPTSLEVAERACRRVMDPNRRADCIFDVRITGNPGFATTYLVTQRILQDSTTISLTDDPEPSQLGELVTFTAYVVGNGSTTGYPSGSVQFAVDGMNVGAPVTVDAKGRATWETTALRVGKHQITSTYDPGVDSVFLPSSMEKIHIVKRCPCGDRK